MQLKDLKKGDTAYRMMERYNPQLGTYVVFEKHQISKVNKASISITLYGSNENYNIANGERKGKNNSVYGSAAYYLLSEEQAIEKHNEYERNGIRISRGL